MGLLFIADIPVGHDAKVDADFGLSPADATAVKHAARVVETWLPVSACRSRPRRPLGLTRNSNISSPAKPRRSMVRRNLAGAELRPGTSRLVCRSLGPAGDTDTDAPGQSAGHYRSSCRGQLCQHAQSTLFGDRHVNSPTSLRRHRRASSLLMEFALLVERLVPDPLELAVNSLCRIQGPVVTDVFGERTLVRAAAAAPTRCGSAGRCSTCRRLRADGTFRGSPAIAADHPHRDTGRHRRESRPAARRDGQPVWAVERIVPSAAGPEIDGYAYADAVLAIAARSRAGRGGPLPARLDVVWNLASLHPCPRSQQQPQRSPACAPSARDLGANVATHRRPDHCWTHAVLPQRGGGAARRARRHT